MTSQPVLTSRAAVWAPATVTIVLGALILRKAFGLGTSAGTAALPLWSLALAAVWTLGGIALMLLARAHARRHRSADPAPGPPTRRSAASAGWRALAIGAVLAGASFLGGWILSLIPATAPWITAALVTAGTSAAGLTLAAAVVTGLAEEVFFRLGLADLFRGRARWIAPTVIYTLVTCATLNPGLIAAAPVVGLAAAWARESTGRWFAPLIVHGLWSLAMVGIFPLVVSLPGGI
ncbi:CPBP family intramembrane metalloprotease [Brevibacterium luteolum]|nr:CPBP family intramembrane metalloprotease [Brevibacterium luteolum]